MKGIPKSIYINNRIVRLLHCAVILKLRKRRSYEEDVFGSHGVSVGCSGSI